MNARGSWPALLLLLLPVATAAAPRAHTYSIVARDPATGDLGVAVQSHWFSVGQVVPWAEAGVGAAATQSLVEVSHGPRGLELMRGGRSAVDALRQLLNADSGRAMRQVAMIDRFGRYGVFTGKHCIAEAGHVGGEQFTCQANLMANDRVPTAMAAAYRAARGDLAERLLAALEAGQRAGGDIRGQQSAALVVVRGRSTGRPWATGDRLFDLRVEDHPRPLVELRRLVQLQRAYDQASRGDEHLAARRFDDAMRAYSEATRLAPDNVELQFWKAASLFKVGREREALPIFRRVFAAEPSWAVTAARLRDLDVLADGPAAFEPALERVLAAAPAAARAEARREWARRRR